MAVKAVNDTAGPEGLVPTLLVFGAYPRMLKLDPPAPDMITRGKAVQKAMEEITKLRLNRKIVQALKERNGPRTDAVRDLPINSQVWVKREKEGWTGPWTLVRVDGQTCTVRNSSGDKSFRITSVKPYYVPNTEEIIDNDKIPMPQNMQIQKIYPATLDNNELSNEPEGERIQLVDDKLENFCDKYREQRARGAYIAGVCQPEASFDLSVAAQNQLPTSNDVKQLNKRLNWQITNKSRGINFVGIDLNTAKLFIFVDGSFAGNKDLSSQIGFIVVLANEIDNDTKKFTIRGNILHWTSVKCKRVTRSVLASELYGMVSGIDIGIAIKTTIDKIFDSLTLPPISIIACTDSYSLYDCLVKLGTTTEKRLMIDIMSLRESYETREITEIRWIDGKDNPADAMTKSTPNCALQRLINDNEIQVSIDGWVDRGRD
ncbi:Ribonuclease h-like protein [Thalictrum thalictroides]|uniref:Ribonuclease h-like protein n=1 Tax=Thalictrum thalictroides TaxID=46969 RepID=A0A7J6X5U6_THATH|nr:Ribonuclease h-like protein [Thalictrum thalictroides]